MQSKNDRLICNIDWDKDFEDLSDDEKANFLSLIKAPFLNEWNKVAVTDQYKRLQGVYKYRGRDKIELYL